MPSHGQENPVGERQRHSLPFVGLMARWHPTPGERPKSAAERLTVCGRSPRHRNDTCTSRAIRHATPTFRSHHCHPRRYATRNGPSRFGSEETRHWRHGPSRSRWKHRRGHRIPAPFGSGCGMAGYPILELSAGTKVHAISPCIPSRNGRI